MHRIRLLSLLLLAPTVVFLASVSGCGAAREPDVGGGDDGGPRGNGGKPVEAANLTPVEGKGWATLEGKATFDGDVPAPESLKGQVEAHKDKDRCLADKSGDSFTNLGWVVNKETKAVANVVVFVRPPTGKYFKPLPADLQSWPKEVKVDQPYCAFEPHVSIAFPSYYDGDKKKLVPTGQKFIVLNDAPIAHNTAYHGSTSKNPGGSYTLEAKKEGGKAAERELTLKPDYTTPISLGCDFHKWMKGYVWALDTPYAAKTDTDGKYAIKNIPAGAEVRVVSWHEVVGFLKGGQAGEPMTLKEGTNTYDITVKPK
jgi:hypothetical protein